MAVYSWIYANAKMEGNRKDYHVRVCDQGLEEYKGTLILLSNRLLSTDRRLGKAEKQNCWFSGYIGGGKKIYLVAVGGEQETILGITLAGSGFRAQHCVLGYGFTEDDIQLYRQEDDIFEPLKKILCRIQQTGKDLESEPEQIQSQHFDVYALHETSLELEGNYNIIQSTPTADTTLWGQSLKRPIMTGIISTDDAKKLLQLFPDGLVSVMENVNLQYAVARKEGEKREVEKTVTETVRSKGLDSTEAETLQKYGIMPSINTNNNEKNSKREGKNEARPKNKEEEKYEALFKVLGKKVVDGLHDLKNQVVVEEREKKLDLDFVQKYAKFCEKRLFLGQKESIQEAVQKLKSPKGFSKQMEYYGYMLLWLRNEENEEPITDEEEIYRKVREWAKLQKTEENVFQRNIQYAKKIERKDGKNGSI